MVQHPKTLIEFMELYPTEEACREALFAHRWPQGFRCPRCGHEKAWQLSGRGLNECASCHYQGSLTAGTVLHFRAHRPAQVVPRDLAARLDEEVTLGGRALPSARGDPQDRLACAPQGRARARTP
jgi:hypothetical protein